mgnify:FL=1
MADRKKQIDMIVGTDFNAGVKADAEQIARALANGGLQNKVAQEPVKAAPKVTPKKKPTVKKMTNAESNALIDAGMAFENNKEAQYVIQGLDDETIIKEYNRRFVNYRKFKTDILARCERG